MNDYVPVRLCDLEPQVLHAAARRAGRDEDPLGRLLLACAAASPSDETYWLPRHVVEPMLPFLAPSSRPDMMTGPASAGDSRHMRDPADRPCVSGDDPA